MFINSYAKTSFCSPPHKMLHAYKNACRHPRILQLPVLIHMRSCRAYVIWWMGSHAASHKAIPFHERCVRLERLVKIIPCKELWWKDPECQVSNCRSTPANISACKWGCNSRCDLDPFLNNSAQITFYASSRDLQRNRVTLTQFQRGYKSLLGNWLLFEYKFRFLSSETFPFHFRFLFAEMYSC